MTSDSGPTVASHRFSGHVGGRKEPGRPYPHIDDILQVTPEGNTSQPLGHLLGIAENGVKYAKFQADIGQIDIALREYIKAYMVAVTIIPSHRDYTLIQVDRKHLGERYNKLTKDLQACADNYESIKQTIKADNARTGVQRATQTSVHNGRPHTPKHQPKNPTVTTSPIRKTSSPAKPKPPVQPKPPNLSGKTIQKPGTGGKGDDLSWRFANLRGPVQDPRIKTQPPPVPIPIEKPAGPREMPKKPPLSMDGAGPILPKLPDAIYSPARSNLSNEAAALPSSTPRGFSRQNSSLSSAAKSPPTQTNDYFGSITSTGPTSTPANEKRRTPLPEGDIITVEEFVKYQRIGSKDFRILVIDVRTRPEFEDGHILSSATICIEPDILQRDRIEAADVEDAMELGPHMEKWHFERRHEFDMVVFYDHDSEHLSSGKTNAPATLFRLLTDFDYPDGDPASKHPKLLKGGLEAWQDAMGGSALQKSSKSSHKKRPSAYDWHRVRSPSKPIQSIEEARRWEEKLTQLRNDEAENGGGDEFQPVRTLSDFMTRFPPLKESMTSPSSGSPTVGDRLDGRSSPGPIRSPPPHLSPQSDHFGDLLPVEPTRPPPTVPRKPYGGLQDTEDDHGAPNKLKKRSDAANRRRALGLENPTGAWCYANSTLQAWFASGGFGGELISGEWAQLYKAPMKSDENIQPPQLLTKILANLFHWMGHGKLPQMHAKTLMEYLRQKSSRNSQGQRVPDNLVLGTNRQQDAMEFLLYVFAELDDETNRFRNRPSEVPQPQPSKTKSLTDLAIQYWDLHSRVSDSIIDKYWRITEVVIVSCDQCGHVVTKYSNKDMQFLSLPQQTGPVLMEDLLRKDYTDELLEDYTCDNCAVKGRCRKGSRLARLPDLLCVCFTRFEKHGDGARFSKITTPVDFPIRELDLTPYTIQGSQQTSPLLANGHHHQMAGMRSPVSTIPTDDHHFNRPFKYEAYAVVQHGGELNSGHYVSIIRDEPHGPDGNSKWHVADDSRILDVTVGSSRSDKGSQFLYKQDRHWGSGMQAFMVFYQRKDAELV
ncbi:ubiquitin carboxyl-terminal hydrolase [Diaporthe helianthi]|uniref:Ubiquitin carboxyl-terminal hydrolase n=1 Tax=Diaporthe helianthi TaxID=158607 RepID=A0A2P5HSZ4_DIAHE|nr:ubiquitin carboxyl-terminal hydrolase [Diaporthe helianthi]